MLPYGAHAMADIFISHVEEDTSVALELAQALEHRGFVVWYYERDTVPGRSYLLQIGDAIDGCHAVLLLISSHSLGSYQVRQEVIRAYESQKPFLPLLLDVSHAEFQTRQPEWRAALGAAASLRIPPEGIRPILPQLTHGLATLGIHAGGPRGTAPRHEGASSPEEVHPPAPPQDTTRARQGAPSSRRTPALVRTWTFVLLGVGVGVGVLSAVFFDVPVLLKAIMIHSTVTAPGGKPGEGPSPDVIDLPQREPAMPTRQLLAGVIWDDHRETVAEVEVFVPEFNVTTFTDRQGKFQLEVQAPSQRQVRLIARKEGYESWSGDPTLGNTSLSFVLRRKL
jgi:hypothetical protein